MSATIDKQRYFSVFAGIIVATAVLIYGGTMWLRSHGFNFIGEVAYALLILILAVLVVDKLLVR